MISSDTSLLWCLFMTVNRKSLSSTHSGQRGALPAPVPPRTLSVMESPSLVHPLSPIVQASPIYPGRGSPSLCSPRAASGIGRRNAAFSSFSGSQLLPASSRLDLWPRSKVLNEGGTPTSLFKARVEIWKPSCHAYQTQLAPLATCKAHGVFLCREHNFPKHKIT